MAVLGQTSCDVSLIIRGTDYISSLPAFDRSIGMKVTYAQGSDCPFRNARPVTCCRSTHASMSLTSGSGSE
jgi:hypothetical protein